jgi:hypothetical protein
MNPNWASRGCGASGNDEGRLAAAFVLWRRQPELVTRRWTIIFRVCAWPSTVSRIQ